MAERSAAATRSRRGLGPAFPERPTHPPDVMCDGVVIVGHNDADLRRLRPLRDYIAGIWTGTLSDTKVLVATFVAERVVDPAVLPTALRLVADSATLSSYVAERHVGARPVPPKAVPQRVELWWGARSRTIALDALEALPLAALWDMPAVVVHRSAATHSSFARPVDGDAPMRVSHAQLVIAEGGIAAFDTTEAALRALHERTRLGAIARQAWGKLFGGPAIGEGGDGTGRGGAGTAAAEPGVLENLAGWVRWHTPLGKGLIAAFGSRMQMVEKLLQSGDVDSALKLALKLGDPGQKTKRSGFPARLPGIRSSLDFNIGSGLFSMPILGGGTFDTMRQRYAALAATLEAQGDHRRAAYVHAQLLGDHLTAVLTLEKGMLYSDAAKLALDAKLDPVVYIRLFYKAGKSDTALALARRTGCFDTLAEDSRKHDADYHTGVVKAWTDMLIATDQHLRALQVTDALAKTDKILIERRREWLQGALELAGNAIPAEVLVRTLLTARWTEEDIARQGFADFPMMADGVAPFALALQRVQSWVRNEGDDVGGDLLALLQSMVRLADSKRIEQAAFWQGPAPIVIDGLVRAIIEGASASLAQRDFETLTALLRQARQEVFATDLAKLRKMYAAPAKPSDNWHLPPPAAHAAPVRHACLLRNGDAVVWRENSLLQLLDRRGQPLWQGNVGDVVGLVAVGSGANVIMVQQVPGATVDVRRLTRFASHRRQFHEIGTVRLIAHHDVTSDGEWLVQIGGEIGALDLVKLCAEAPAIEFLWSCKLTEQLRAIGFLHQPQCHAWITRTTQPERCHLLEMFQLRDTRTLETRIGKPATSGGSVRILPPADWFWDPMRGFNWLELPTSQDVTLPFVSWTDQAEREVVRMMAARDNKDGTLDTIQSGDFGRHRIGPPADGTPGLMIVNGASGTKAMRLTLRHAAEDALRCVARAPIAEDDTAGGVLLADAYGRLLHVDLARRAVAIL
ncbi:hypothetical protein [Sphingomonas sp. PB4P5]|uniref:hypothetical protein n=1 Tax=Parasphingomonas puruogangriensis TaxID=3096155 RepID=UPI002FC67627